MACHLLSGLPSSWRVSALIFATGLSPFLVLSHSWVSLHTMTCAALPSTLTPPLPLVSSPSMPALEPVSGSASSPGVATSMLSGHLGDDATGRSSAGCHYSAPQKGLSPNIWKAHQRPWSHQAVPSGTCQNSHLWTREQKEQPSLGWPQPVAMAQ